MEAVLALSALSAAAWAWLLFARHGFWRDGPYLNGADPAPAAWPDVVAVVPARNEAPYVGRALRSLLEQRYAGRLAIVLVDDDSSDGTGEIARRLAGEPFAHALHVVRARPLPRGWSGKLWAVQEGLREAERIAADARYVLLTDADIGHDADSVRRLVAAAERSGLDLVSLMVLLRCRTLVERLLVPPFVFFFKMLYPFRAVSDPAARTAAAAGGCMLVRRSALEAAGGVAAVRSALIDDVALARVLKGRPGGGRIWLGLTRASTSLRSYGDLGEIWRTVARTADTQLGHSLWLLAGTVAAMLLTFAAPPFLLAAALAAESAPAAALSGAAWLAMTVAFGPTARLYGQSPARGLLLPVVAALYLGMTLDSALRYRLGRGGTWKGRIGAPRPERGRIDTVS